MTTKKKAKKRTGKPATAKAKKPASAAAVTAVSAPLEAPGSPQKYRARVRMYRHGLGDCFLVTFPREGQTPFQMLIDCGALARDAKHMRGFVSHVRETIRDASRRANGNANGEASEKALVDVVVATHEHKDHLSGFNQARSIFNEDFDFGAVWLGWTENLTKPEIKKIKEARKKTVAKLEAALASPLAAAALSLDGVSTLLAFNQDDDTTGSGRIAEALEYLKLRGKSAGNLRYLEPGEGPFSLDGVDDVRVYVLGPPRDPLLLKGSEVTEQMKKDDVVYHLAATGEAGVEALCAAVSATTGLPSANGERYFPFSAEHRIAPQVADASSPGGSKPNPYFKSIRGFLKETYDHPKHSWRRIDDDWINAFGQLALDLDNDTNNTSLVLAFEFVKTQEVLLFVGDAQVGNWKSWAGIEFKVPGMEKPLPAHDLLARTAFYKVGHHCSHNATLKKGGLELMNRDDLVAFVPLDQETARNQGEKGWEMPAPALFKALEQKAGKRVVLSDVTEALTPEAQSAGVIATDAYVDYFLK